MNVYRIFTPSQWDASDEQLPLSSLDINDGYIHLSTYESVVETANRYFAAEPHLLVASFDAQQFGTALKMEYVATRAAYFPHLYATALLKSQASEVLFLVNSNTGFQWKQA